MDIINIGVDLDGVLLDFSIMFSKYCNKRFGERCPIVTDRTVVTDWDWEKWYHITKEEIKLVWKDIEASKNFWQKLPLINRHEFDALRTSFNKYDKKTNVVVYFITARSSSAGDNLHLQCINSLAQYHWKNPQIILSKEKGQIVKNLNIKYFIDDKVENCIDAKKKNPECNVYIMDASYNKHLTDTNIKRTSSLYHFINDIWKDKNYKGILL